MKLEVIKGVKHSIELNFGESSVCITPDEAQKLIGQLQAVVPVPSDVEEAAESWSSKTHFSWPNQVPAGKQGFIAGAEWQKEQMEKKISLIQKSWYEEGKIAGKYEGLTDDEKYQQGAFDERERLMKEAVEGRVCKDPTADQGPCYYVETDCGNFEGFAPGDKVSVIIIKKDEK